jgi:hypothetical protein
MTLVLLNVFILRRPIGVADRTYKNKNNSANGLKSMSKSMWYVIFEKVGIRAAADLLRYPTQRFTIELQKRVFDMH